MFMKKNISSFVVLAISLSLILYSCRRNAVNFCKDQVSITSVSVIPSFQSRPSGTITVNATGDTTLTYSLDGITFQSSAIFTGLAANSYIVTAKNSKGCTDTTAATVGLNPDVCAGVTITVTAAKTDPTNNQANGSITVTATGGSGFTYSKDGINYQASNVFSNLGPNTYTITAKTAAGCTKSTQVTLTDPCAGVTITVTTIKTDPTNNQANGSITVTATGGSGFTYSKDGINYQASNVFSNLGPNTYTITAKTAAGCTKSTQVTLTDPCAGKNIVVSIVTKPVGIPQCPAPIQPGTITVTASGSTGFTYSIDGVNFQQSNVFTVSSAGNYTVRIRDSGGCIVTRTITVGSVSSPC